MPTLRELEAHSGLINLIGLLLALLGIAISIYFGLRPRQSAEDRYAKEKAQREQELRDELPRAVGDELKRVTGELAALQAANFERDKAISESAARALGRFEPRFPPKRLKIARKALEKRQTLEAEKLFHEVLENDPVYASEATYQLGALAEIRSDFSAAKDWYYKAVKLEPDNPVYLAPAGRLALDFEEIAEAEDLLERALGRLSDESELRARVLNGLGDVRAVQARYGEAEAYYRQALAVRERVLGKEHPDTAQSLNSLGDSCYAQRGYREAEDYHRQALAIRERVLGKEHPDTAESLDSLGDACNAQGGYREAEDYHRQALAIIEKLLGDEHPETAESLNGLGADCGAQGRFEEAEGYFCQALAIQEKVFGREHPKPAASVANLGAICGRQARHGEAESYARRALPIREKVFGKEHPLTARSLNSLGTDCHAQGRYWEAENYHRQALTIREKVLGKEHPDTAESLHSLGVDCYSLGRYGEAEGYTRQALAIREKVLGAEHPDTADSLDNLGANSMRKVGLSRQKTVIVRRSPFGSGFSEKNTPKRLTPSPTSEPTAATSIAMGKRRTIIAKHSPSERKCSGNTILISLSP